MCVKEKKMVIIIACDSTEYTITAPYLQLVGYIGFFPIDIKYLCR